MEAVLDSGVIGRGLVAQSLRRLVNHHPQAIFFASGTGDSTCRDQMIFSRERELLEAAIGDCRRAGLRLVYCSSAGAVYGCFPGMRDEETECLPVTPYGIHKLGCEALVRTSDVHHLILRISNLVGPSANACQLLPSLVRQILSGVVRVDREACRDLIRIGEFCEVLDELLENAGDQETVIMAAGISTTVQSLVWEIETILHLKARMLPGSAGVPHHFDVAKLRRLAPRTAQFDKDYPLAILQHHIPIIVAELNQSRRAA